MAAPQPYAPLSETGQLWRPLTGEHLRESFGPATDVGWFYLLAAAPGLLGLLWAYLSDRVSLMETRREGYVVLACLIPPGQIFCDTGGIPLTNRGRASRPSGC